jgi:hypothetical protein
MSKELHSVPSLITNADYEHTNGVCIHKSLCSNSKRERKTRRMTHLKTFPSIKSLHS